MIRIIDNKKLDLTNDEFTMYQNIVKSYTSATSNGEDLFIDLFETNEQGILVFLKPPSTRHTSFEVFLFLMSIFQHQHIRIMESQVLDICEEMKTKMAEIEEKLKLLK